MIFSLIIRNNDRCLKIKITFNFIYNICTYWTMHISELFIHLIEYNRRNEKRYCYAYENPNVRERLANFICVSTSTLTIIFVPLFQVNPLHILADGPIRSPKPINVSLMSEFIKKDLWSLILNVFLRPVRKITKVKLVSAFTKFYRTIMHAN